MCRLVQAFVPWACSTDDASPNQQVKPEAGAAGDDSTHGGEGGTAGMGPGGRGNGGTQCEPKSVDDYCEWLASRSEACPKNPNDFELDNCSAFHGVRRYQSDCGGVIVEVWGDKMDGFNYYSDKFSFDAQGKLVGVGQSTDVAGACPDVYGKPCKPVGKAEPLCESGGAGGQPGVGGEPSVGGAGAGGAGAAR